MESPNRKTASRCEKNPTGDTRHYGRSVKTFTSVHGDMIYRTIFLRCVHCDQEMNAVTSSWKEK